MSSNYDAIREDNLREYGEGTRHLSFLGRLYSDRTHFLYELLQNAEDACASKVSFMLYPDRLVVLHDGEPFSEADVRGICGVGEGVKSEDLTKIGRFGVGFKSVYAYTSKPVVHSGGENFSISHYVRPYPVERIDIPDKWTTKFIFPFDDVDIISPDVAFDEIGDRLKTLSARTLLFLRNIKEIEWKIDKQQPGQYLREHIQETPTRRRVTVIGQSDAGNVEDESWIIFDRDVQLPNNVKARPVEVAYALTEEKDTKREIISRIQESPLVVFFPTEKETHLGFMIQGAYRTTPARDNIPKDDDWNKRLVRETGELLRDSLLDLRELGLLDVNVLQALPIRAVVFQPENMFYPLYEAVKNTLLDEKLIPTNDNSFIVGKYAKLGRGSEIRSLISRSQLKDLFEEEHDVAWISEQVTQERTPDLRTYLLRELDVDEVAPEALARRISEKFLSMQSDEWMVLFYKFLLGQEALWKKTRYQWGADGILRNKPFVRVETGKHIVPFNDDDSLCVYFPKSGVNSFNTIKKSLLDDNEVREFFKRLGVHEPDIVAEVLENIVPLYESDEIEVSDEDHIKHLNLILDALKVDSVERREKLVSKLQETYFSIGCNAATEELAYLSPYDLYIRTTELEEYFDGNDDIWFVSDQYDQKIFEMIEKLGASREVRVIARRPDSRGYVKVADYHGYHRRGLHGFDPTCEVEGLEHALQNPDFNKSKYIWSQLVLPNVVNIRGIVESCARQTYEGSSKVNTFSHFGEYLEENEWLPTRNGEFKKPSEIALHELPDEFDRDDGVASQLNMKSNEVSKLASSIGIDPGDIELLKQLKNNPDEYDRVRTLLAQIRNKPKFPTRESKNPERRMQKKKESSKEAETKNYEKKERSVRTSTGAVDPKTFLKELYTNDDEKMVCQVCEEEMPFKKRDGDYYFEAVELFSDTTSEHEEAYAAMCPICAAKYKEFIKSNNDKMRALKDTVLSGEETSYTLELGNESKSLRFVQTHLLDLKAVLE